MRELWSLLTICLLLIGGTSSLSKDGSDFDNFYRQSNRDDWVDPDDMGVIRTIRKQSTMDDQVDNLVEDKETGRKPLLGGRKPSSSKPAESKVETNLMMKRFLKSFLKTIEADTQDPSQSIDYNVHLHLTNYQLNKLVQYSRNVDVNIHDVDSILSSMFISYSINLPGRIKISDEETEWRLPLVDATLALVLVITIIWSFKYLPLWKLFIGLVLFSVMWHWLHMYKNALAAKQATINKEIPAECRPKEASYFEYGAMMFKGFFSISKDACTEYEKALAVDPIYDVNPLMAFTDLTANIVFNPLTVLCSQTGKALHGLLEPLPAFAQLWVSIGLFVILILSLILLSGYAIKLPFLLGFEIRPGTAGSNRLLGQQLKEAKRKLEELTKERDTSRSKQLHLEQENDKLYRVLTRTDGLKLLTNETSTDGKGARGLIQRAVSTSGVEDLKTLDMYDDKSVASKASNNRILDHDQADSKSRKIFPTEASGCRKRFVGASEKTAIVRHKVEIVGDHQDSTLGNRLTEGDGGNSFGEPDLSHSQLVAEYGDSLDLEASGLELSGTNSTAELLRSITRVDVDEDDTFEKIDSCDVSERDPLMSPMADEKSTAHDDSDLSESERQTLGGSEQS